MENINHNNDPKKEKLITPIVETEQEELRNEENMEKNSSSTITSNFAKKHARSNNSFGAGHEPGTTPGTGV
jgi:hypothetical protein